MTRTLNDLFTRCCTVHVTANDHRTTYETVAQYLAGRSNFYVGYDPDEVATLAHAATIIEIHFYPRTPISSYLVIAATLDKAVAKAHNILDRER